HDRRPAGHHLPLPVRAGHPWFRLPIAWKTDFPRTNANKTEPRTCRGRAAGSGISVEGDAEPFTVAPAHMRLATLHRAGKLDLEGARDAGRIAEGEPGAPLAQIAHHALQGAKSEVVADRCTLEDLVAPRFA